MLIGGPDDGVITPWQSRYPHCRCVMLWLSMILNMCGSFFYSHFGFYDEELNVQSYQTQEVR